MSVDKSSEFVGGDASVELASNRTSLSFERTRWSLDGALMSVVRTSLSLIGFGFTIHQVFSKASALIPRADVTARNLGLALLTLGLALLVMGLVSHRRSERALDQRRQRLHEMGLLRREAHYRATPTYGLVDHRPARSRFRRLPAGLAVAKPGKARPRRGRDIAPLA